jgi:hypothetical protein
MAATAAILRRAFDAVQRWRGTNPVRRHDEDPAPAAMSPRTACPTQIVGRSLRAKLQQLLHFSRPGPKQYQFGTLLEVPGKYWEPIMKVAVDNCGYVTPELIAPLGVPAVELRKMVARSVLTAGAHGVYRVPSLPIDTYDEFILARLCAKGRGVVSHDSALVVHELCEINPTKVHITIPHHYRISRAGVERYAIHGPTSNTTRRPASAP